MYNLLITKATDKLWPTSVTTSPAIPVRRIGRADGPDWASLGHFAKKSSLFYEINPQSGILS
jgi:hypothetical protein